MNASRAGYTFIQSVEVFFRDLAYGIRLLRRNPAFALIAVLTLALGIGSSTAVFSLVNSIVLKPLPYAHPQQIVLPWRMVPPGISIGFDEFPWGRVEFLFFQSHAKTFQALGAFKSDSFNLTGRGDPVRLDGIRASSGFFPALGVEPVLGRTFTPEEDQPGQEGEVLLSYPLWRDRFGGDASIVGQTLELNGSAYRVIGVMPSGFSFPRAEEMPGILSLARRPQIWVPLALVHGPLIPAEPSELALIGRLNPGVTPRDAQTEMTLLGKQLELQYPRSKGWFNTRLTLLSRQVSSGTRRPLLLILGAVCVVLLIACSNVANLLLTRALGRRREMVVRAALGAGSARLVRQLLTESLALAVAGAALGIAVAAAGIALAKTFGPPDVPRLAETTLDSHVLLFTIGIAILTGILFGLPPVFATERRNLIDALKEGGQRAGASPAGARIRKTLLVAQVALAMVLVVAAGLLSRTFVHMLNADPGFNPDRVLTYELTLPSKYKDVTQIVQFYTQLRKKLEILPGVQSAGIVETVPMGGATESTAIRIPDHPVAQQQNKPIVNYTIVSPGYFDAVGTPLLRGRDFQETDTADSTPVTVINLAMANRFWPGQNPLGKMVGPASPKYPVAAVIGIVPNVKHMSLREQSDPEMYVLYTQKVWPSLLTMDVVLRTKTEPAAILSAVREATRSLDSDVPIANVATLRSIVHESMAKPRFSMLLLGSFAALALILASVGMYGVISCGVMQRTREIGVRIALGARRESILAMVIGEGARLVGLGMGIGLIASLAVTRLMAGFLYGVQPNDPPTLIAVFLLLIAVALAACYIPARRAAATDPIVALRYE